MRLSLPFEVYSIADVDLKVTYSIHSLKSQLPIFCRLSGGESQFIVLQFMDRVSLKLVS